MKGFFAAALASTAALTNAASVGLNRQTADFDDITVDLAVASLQPIGVYRGLNWDGFNVINVGNAVTGVQPVTRPNVAVQYVLTSGLDATSTLKPASSKVAYFSLQSFYFGCVASSQETVAGVPLACSLTLTGKRNGRNVVSQDISFAGGNQMKRVTFAGAWQNVDEVDFKQTGLLGAATSVLYDNVQYTTFTTL